MSLIAVLVGIDDYPEAARKLSGCVHDIDAIEEVLRRRTGEPLVIHRLSARRGGPAPGAGADPAPTLANLRARLAALRTETAPGDRVLVYYSGHGTRIVVVGGGAPREALVPLDAGTAGPLFDHELDAALSGLARDGRHVGCILDCCFGAGIARSPRREDGAIRFVQLAAAVGAQLPPSPRDDGVVRTIDGCHVVAACLHHEHARERERDGRTHGVLTRALVGALEGLAGAELDRVPWSRIWDALRAEIERESPAQHPWMGGDPGRPVLAGPAPGADAGIAVRAVGAAYQLAAGALSGITEGAELAVYGDEPPRFAPLDSDADRAARHGVLRVDRAGASAAIAVAVAPFALPPGARARVTRLGPAARLRCAVTGGDPALEAAIAEAIAASALLERVEPAAAQVRLERAGDAWLVADDLHDATPDGALYVLPAADAGRARAVLEHYASYAVPLRLAEAAAGGDLLAIDVLACPRPYPPDPHDPDLAPVPAPVPACHEVPDGAPVCVRVHNRGAERTLRVALLDVAPSGRVFHLGDAAIEPGRRFVFWAQGQPGAPMVMTAPAGRPAGLDRLIAIGVTAHGHELHHLAVRTGFDDAGRPATPPPPAPRAARLAGDAGPGGYWTAAQAIVRTRR